MLGWALMVVAAGPLDAAERAIDQFRPRAALSHLERAQSAGPHDLKTGVRLYAALGKARAYLGQAEQAVAAFEHLLRLDPAASLSYTLSPKVTFLFERARARALARPPLSLDLNWPSELRVDRPISFSAEALGDEDAWLQRIRVHHRLRGESTYATQSVDLSGGRGRFDVPAAAPERTKDAVLEVFARGYDAFGNEVHRWHSDERPRALRLRYVRATRWYERWWVWAVAGVAAAGGTALAVRAATRAPPEQVPGTLVVP